MRRALIMVLVMLAAGAAACRAEGLLWYAEDGSGKTVATHGADTPFNPASVVKVGMSWFALERLGAAYRYPTRFGFTGTWNRSSDTIVGDLVVTGAGDPDFQPENAFLVARELNRMGIRRVTGDMVVEGRFWIGWEGGPFQRAADPVVREQRAGKRLKRALDMHHWGMASREAWEKLCSRRGWLATEPPSVEVDGVIRVEAVTGVRPLMVHRSNPLAVILKRFNVYSNNDIERIADGLGGAEALEAFLRDKVGGSVRLETACGLGRNRMTAMEIVRMISGFQAWLADHRVSLRDILPVPGCDPGPVPRMFPALASGKLARAVTCKSGTLSDTDGGVAVLAGVFRPPKGREVIFCVAAPEAGGELHRLRGREESWLAGLIRDRGGALALNCGARLLFSDTEATVTAEPELGGRN